MTRLLLLSTYELGCQPLGIALPAAGLRRAGHDVRVADLAVSAFPSSDLAWAERLICSVPMHTGLRLGLAAIERVRQERPDMPIALHGLYAPVAAGLDVLRSGDCAVAGDALPTLLSWVENKLADETTVRVELGPPRTERGDAVLPDRRGIESLAHYATLRRGEEVRSVGTVETTSGCNHRCRHCPVAAIYQGRSRIVGVEMVAADIDGLVEAGAEHIHFADADFLNRPRHAHAVVERLHRHHPQVSFDATIKVSHLLRHRALLPVLSSGGLAFITSAFESTSDLVLDRLDKGHVATDLPLAVALLRAVDVEIRPSLLPFTPWTARSDLVELFDFVAAHDLIWNVDPVQFSIRLLLPPGSLLLEQPDPVLEHGLGEFDRETLGYRWRSGDPVLDTLQLEIADRCEVAMATAESPPATYEALRALVFERLGLGFAPTPGLRGHAGPPGFERPRLSEGWFCCAEPTSSQAALVGRGSIACP